ncbi:MAG TPA: hypothetical protein PKL08_15915 [Thermoanaerobaculaceae bacterium]|nr:hypothetical protein [Thermoanaerobaculaceae bacterium]
MLRILREWVRYSNHACPHTSLGPGIPGPADGRPVPLQEDRHRLAPGARAMVTPVLGGLVHNDRLDKEA